MRKSYFLFFSIFIASYIINQNVILAQDKIENLTLTEAIKVGLENNPSIQSANAKVLALEGRFWNEISLPRPEISYENQWLPSGNIFNGFGEKTFAISQQMEFPSIYFLKGSKLKKEEGKSKIEYNLKEIELIRSIKTAYYKALYNKLILTSAEENLAISQNFLKKAEIKENIGEGSKLEKMTAKVQLSEANSNLEISKNEFSKSLEELIFSMGLKSNTHSNFHLTDSLSFVNYEHVIQNYYSNCSSNPQITLDEKNKEILEVEESLASSSFLPDINFSYYLQSRDNNNGYYGASLGISIPLWFLFEQRGKIQEAKANYKAAEYNLKQTINQENYKIQNALKDFENNLEQVNLYTEEIIPQANEIFRTASESYNAGEANYIEFLQAKQTLLNAQNNYNKSLLNYYLSIFEIEEIIGKNIILN